MAEMKEKGGFTVSELEGKMKKFGVEIVLCAMFVLTGIFSLIWGGAMLFWAVILAMVGGIVGTLLPKAIHKMMNGALAFATKEKGTSMAVAIAVVLVSIFVPIITFALIGLMSGKAFVTTTHRASEHSSNFEE